ncbi:MAG: site-specific integrase [Bacteroides sp.]|nr:site-specific integrase [Bacteroides sp.]
MISIKLKFIPSLIEGKEGRLFYQVIYNSVIQHIASPHSILPEEWNTKAHRLAICPHSSRIRYLESIKRGIQYDVTRLRSIVKKFIVSGRNFVIDEVITEYRKQSSEHSLFIYMERMIAQYRLHGQYRTGETYASTLSSFSKFRRDIDVMLEDINSEMLEEYTSFLKHNNLSTNTISFYLKHLRAVYNRAVENELIIDRRPFKRVSTSMEKTSKRALSLKVIRQLKELNLSHNHSDKFARDMFLFSFYTRGMSFVDIAYLQKGNLKGGVLFYRRKKTNQPLTIHWESCMQEILNTYRAKDSSPYLFSIIQDPINHRKEYQNASYLINRHLKEIGKRLGLNQPLTMYCARHSWASIAHDEGIPLSVISEGMGHDSEKTTQIYLTSLEKGVIDSANRKILRLL